MSGSIGFPMNGPVNKQISVDMQRPIYAGLSSTILADVHGKAYIFAAAIFCKKLRQFGVILRQLYQVNPTHVCAVFISKKQALIGIDGGCGRSNIGSAIDLDAAGQDATSQREFRLGGIIGRLDCKRRGGTVVSRAIDCG